MSPRSKMALATLAAFGAAAAALFAFQPRLLELVAIGEERKLRDAETAAPAATPADPTLLVLALDGVDRDLLYGMLRHGELPELASLLGTSDGDFAHAHFDETLLSTLPSSTLAAWATVFTGTPPAAHGVAGNEYFVRETRTFAAPAPVSILDPSPVLATYTDGFANKLLATPTVYESLRQRDAQVSAWVSMSQFHAGADRLLLAGRTVVADAFKALLVQAAGDPGPRGVYAELDEEVIDTLVDALEKDAPPRFLTVYLTGTDHYAHGAEAGPDPARRQYLKEVVDPALGKLHAALDRHHALDERTVVVVSDHGHTEVRHDDAHALSTDDHDDPPAVVRGAGFRLRPFELEVDAKADFQAVLAYGGAMAYVYVADRSTCTAAGAPCDWARPPRYEADVVPLAEAFFQANRTGLHAPGMKGTLDMVLTRRPRAFAEADEPFAVYVGGGKTEPLAAYLEKHPHPTYVAMERRLAELSVGRFGERAGDVLLLARNGNEARPDDRYYFAGLYRSWHGSPSRRDSEVPLVVAHPKRTKQELATLVRTSLGAAPTQAALAKLFSAALGVRESAAR